MTNKKTEHKIQKLLETTPFDQLSEGERKTILSLYTLQEYEAMYALFMECKTDSSTSDITPNPSTIIALNNAWDAQHSKEKAPFLILLTNFLTFKIRAYQVALIALLFLGLGYFLSNRQPVAPESYIAQQARDSIVKVIDTIYIETAPQTIVQVVNTVSPAKKEQATKPTISSSVNHKEEFAFIEATAPSLNDISNSFGNSAIEGDALVEFTTQL